MRAQFGYLQRPDGPAFVQPVFEDRELRQRASVQVVVGRAPVLQDEGSGEVVEGGPQVMDEVSAEDRDPKGRRRLEVRTPSHARAAGLLADVLLPARGATDGSLRVTRSGSRGYEHKHCCVLKQVPLSGQQMQQLPGLQRYLFFDPGHVAFAMGVSAAWVTSW